MAVFLYELRQMRIFILWWTVAITLLAVTILPTYIGFMNGPNSFDMDVLSGFMDNKFLSAIGLSSDFQAQPIGMFGFLTGWIFSLSLSVNAMYIGLFLHTKEYLLKTTDFLMTKPLSRSKIYIAKLLAGLLQAVFLTTLYLLLAFFVMNLQTGNKFNHKVFWLIGCSIYLLQLLYLSIGVFWGTVAPKNRLPLQTTVAFVFLTVIIGTFANAMSNSFLTYLSPPRYFAGSEIYTRGGYDMKYLIFLLIVTTVLLTTSYYIYGKKDVVTVS